MTSLAKFITQPNCLRNSLLSSSGVSLPSFGKIAVLITILLPAIFAGSKTDSSDTRVPAFPKRNSLRTTTLLGRKPNLNSCFSIFPPAFSPTSVFLQAMSGTPRMARLSSDPIVSELSIASPWKTSNPAPTSCWCSAPGPNHSCPRL